MERNDSTVWARNSVNILVVLIILKLVSCNYPCICDYNNELFVRSSPVDTGEIIDYMYEFDCRPQVNVTDLDSKWFAIATFGHQLGFVQKDNQVVLQECWGDIPPEDKITVPKTTIVTTTPSTTMTQSTVTTQSTLPTETSTTTTKSTIPTISINTATQTTLTTTQSITMATQQPNNIVQANLYCLSCTDTVKPKDCGEIIICGSHEQCFTDSYLTDFGTIRYNLGCRDTKQCSPMTSSLIGRRSVSGLLICSQCCSDGNICNNQGCGETGYGDRALRGPVCASCQTQAYANDCNKVTVCGRDEMCSLRKFYNSKTQETRFKTECIGRNSCLQQLNSLLQYVNVIGRREILEVNAGGSCVMRCCDDDLCNTNCNDKQPLSTSTSPTSVSKTDNIYTTIPSMIAESTTTAATSFFTLPKISFVVPTGPITSSTAIRTATISPSVKQSLSHPGPSVFTTSVQTLDPCLENPCAYGTCSPYGTSYRCTCVLGYFGRNCTETLHALMKVSLHTSLCQHDAFQFGHFCYNIVTKAKNWDLAELHCTLNGGHLLSITNANEEEYIYQLLNEFHISEPVWTGLNDKLQEGMFKWSSGNSDFYHITLTWKHRINNPHNNDEDCVVLEANKYPLELDDTDCLLRHAFVCKYQANTSVTSTFKSSTSRANAVHYSQQGNVLIG